MFEKCLVNQHLFLSIYNTFFKYFLNIWYNNIGTTNIFKIFKKYSLNISKTFNKYLGGLAVYPIHNTSVDDS